MAQLVERSLAIPQVRCSNPVIDKIYFEHLYTVNCIAKTKIKKKRPGMAVFFKKKHQIEISFFLRLDSIFDRSKEKNLQEIYFKLSFCQF